MLDCLSQGRDKEVVDYHGYLLSSVQGSPRYAERKAFRANRNPLIASRKSETLNAHWKIGTDKCWTVCHKEEIKRY
ncbi:hypothetical protein TNIN_198201 [Trichonephila inaurata madagascariensis]|uniref:Uncharacterized protein n=1 Tax=Trichonephila inaurata madagascariensis TaxID=2747483 RepID=A0A8X7BMY4_9ARAC|nr:hypothetical protein TNIN_198201 [Trichonephila inaurata madagascariensis]